MKREEFRTCSICQGTLWVCENHPAKAWEHPDGCDCGAGMPCVCNPCGYPDPETVQVWGETPKITHERN